MNVACCFYLSFKKKTIPNDIEAQLQSLREGVAMLERHKSKVNIA